jgi:hypothetical protein
MVSRQFWAGKVPFMSQNGPDDHVYEKIGNCHEVIKLLREAGK